jgi:hypothetical protein
LQRAWASGHWKEVGLFCFLWFVVYCLTTTRRTTSGRQTLLSACLASLGDQYARTRHPLRPNGPRTFEDGNPAFDLEVGLLGRSARPLELEHCPDDGSPPRDVPSQSTGPVSKSGRWTGFWRHPVSGQRGNMTLDLVVEGTTLRGVGADYVGPFTMTGKITDSDIFIAKQYTGAHLCKYRGNSTNARHYSGRCYAELRRSDGALFGLLAPGLEQCTPAQWVLRWAGVHQPSLPPEPSAGLTAGSKTESSEAMPSGGGLGFTVLGASEIPRGLPRCPRCNATYGACIHTVWVHLGPLSALSVLHNKSVLYGAFVWARAAFNAPPKRRLSAPQVHQAAAT